MNTGRTRPGRAPLLALAALLCAAAWLAPAEAHARLTSRGWLGADVAFTNPSNPMVQPGAGAELGVELSFDDFWAVVAATGVAYHLGRDGETEDDPALPALVVSDVALGARYAFDVIQYVPWIGVNALFYPSGPPELGSPTPALFGAELEVGLTYRVDREWSIGGRIALQSATSDLGGLSLYASAGINVGYHWRW